MARNKQAEDMRVIEVMRENGDPLAPKRDVRHYCYFEAAHDAEKFAAQLREIGFSVECEPSAADDGKTLALASRDDSAEPTTLFPILDQVASMTEAAGGEYDGWEAAIVRTNAPRKSWLRRLFGG